MTSTSSPSTGNDKRRVDRVAEGIEDAGDVEIDGLGVWTQTLLIGREMYSAKQPGTVHADAAGVSTKMTPSGQAVAAPAADDVAFAADDLPGKKSATFEPTSTISPTNSWPIDHRDGDRLLRPVVPVVDMEIGAADGSALDPDQDVVDADPGDGNVFQPQPGSRRVF